jgi:hypothetical protein
MTQSTLRQVLTVFETADSPLSLSQIARDLDITPDRLEGMIQHWVRKGKIRHSRSLTECGSCGHYCGQQGGCPFVMPMPRSYELVTVNDTISLNVMSVTCDHQSGKKRSS